MASKISEFFRQEKRGTAKRGKAAPVAPAPQPAAEQQPYTGLEAGKCGPLARRGPRAACGCGQACKPARCAARRCCCTRCIAAARSRSRAPAGRCPSPPAVDATPEERTLRQFDLSRCGARRGGTGRRGAAGGVAVQRLRQCSGGLPWPAACLPCSAAACTQAHTSKNHDAHPSRIHVQQIRALHRHDAAGAVSGGAAAGGTTIAASCVSHLLVARPNTHLFRYLN